MVNADLLDFCYSFKFSNKKTFHFHFKGLDNFLTTVNSLEYLFGKDEILVKL